MRTMSIRTSKWPAGTPCWADMSVPEVAAMFVSPLGRIAARTDPNGAYFPVIETDQSLTPDRSD